MMDQIHDSITSRPARAPASVLRVERPDRLVTLAPYLPDPERGLILAVYGDGLSFRALAAIRGDRDWEVRRHLARIIRRLGHPAFVLVALNHHAWPREQAAVGVAIFIEGLAVRAAAARLGLSLHAVRQQRDLIVALAHKHDHRHNLRPRARALTA